jgi:hypothetical protein
MDWDFKDVTAIYNTTRTSTKNLHEGKAGPPGKTHNLTAIFVPIVWENVKPRHLTILWAPRAVTGTSLPFYCGTL